MDTSAQHVRQLLNYLAVTRQGVLDAIEGLDEAQLAGPMVPGGWSARDVLAHLLVWDAAKLDFVRRRATPGTSMMGPMMADLDNINEQTVDDWRGRPLDDLLAELHRVRAEFMTEVGSLSADDLDAPAGPPWDPGTTVQEAIEGTAEHNTEHAEELAAWWARLGLQAAQGDAAPEPMSKADLLGYVHAARQQVLDALGGLSREQFERAGVTAEGWSPRDLLATLAAWDREVAAAVGQIVAGQHPLIPDMSADDLAHFDARAVERGRTLSLEDLRREVHTARAALLAAVAPLSDAALYQPPSASGDTVSTVAGFLHVRAAQDSGRAGELALWRAML